MRLTRSSPLLQYALALGVWIAATVLGVAFQRNLGDGFPFALHIVAVLISGGYGGLGPALCNSLLGAFSLRQFVLDPVGWISVEGVESQTGLLLYLIVTIGMAFVCGAMRRERLRVEQRTREIVNALEEKLLVERNLNRTALELERSDAFHRLITDLTSDFTFRMRLEGESAVLEYVSPGFVAVTGYTQRELEDRGGWRSIVHEADHAVFEHTLAASKRGQSDRNELRITNRQGEECWVRYLTQPQQGTTGEYRVLVGAAQQITEQKQLERVRGRLMEELAEKNAFIEAVIGQVPVGIVVAEAETQRLITSNKEAQRLTGIDFSVGQCIEGIVPQNDLHAFAASGAEFQPGQSPLARALRGELIHSESVTLERKDRTTVSLSVNAGPIRDSNGNVIAAVSAFYDVSERRLHEKQVIESQRFLRCSLDSLSSHIAVLDECGNILEVNEAWRRFADENQFTYFKYGVGANYLAPFDGQSLECGEGKLIARGIRDVMEGRSDRFEFEYPCHSPDQQRWFLMRVTRFSGEGPLRVVVAHENVTKLRLALDALRESDRRKDEFLATLAHELRNPLAPIHNAVQILKLPDNQEATRLRTLDIMERQTSQLTRLVDDLMDVSRVMRGKIELRLQTVDLRNVLEQAIESCDPLIVSREHTVDVQVPESPVLVCADPVRLTQILGNLLTNAAKYTEPNGRILVSVKSDATDAIIAIQDNGIGIETEKLHGIFELFVQVDHATTRSQGGLGIGLTLVKNLVELHGGHVMVQSDGLGCGSTFTVRLPLMATSPLVHSMTDEAPGSLVSEERSDARASRCRVLVVDDNRDAANSLGVLLKAMGHEVCVAHCGIDALENARKFEPDILFLDIGMPEMDGYEVARRLRMDSRFDRVCLAALTGWGQADDRRRTSEAGFDYHIVKPPELPRLLSVIAEATRKNRQQAVTK